MFFGNQVVLEVSVVVVDVVVDSVVVVVVVFDDVENVVRTGAPVVVPSCWPWPWPPPLLLFMFTPR